MAPSPGVNNSARKGKIKNDEIADWTPTCDLYPGEIAYVWYGALRSSIVAESLAKSRFAIRAQVMACCGRGRAAVSQFANFTHNIDFANPETTQGLILSKRSDVF